MQFQLVDVFTSTPYRGNSLSVFPDAGGLSTGRMAQITGELRAAGCVAAYLHRHGQLGDDEDAELRQGRFIDRPSRISISARNADGGFRVSGGVVLVGSGRLDVLPS
jgi:predicted PhzF superfamily epimerase YddE/YHI9